MYTSEILRLGFMLVGSALCAIIFFVLSIASYNRLGPADWRTLTFTVLTLIPCAICVRVVRNVFLLRDR